jgi:hypothetical protein
MMMPKKLRPDSEGKRYPLGMRTSKETRERLEEAAAKSGRSLAQEVEIRLERSFEFAHWMQYMAESFKDVLKQQEAGLVELAGGPDNFAVAMRLAYVMTIEAEEAGGNWRDNEEVRHRVEARLLATIPGILRNPPAPWGSRQPPGFLSEMGDLIAKAVAEKAAQEQSAQGADDPAKPVPEKAA